MTLLAKEYFREQLPDLVGLQPFDFEVWVQRYPENQRVKFRRAYAKVCELDLTSRDAIVNNFLKFETTVRLTDPRNISPRRAEFLVIVGPYIAAIEKALKAANFLVKGYNIRERDKKMSNLINYDTFIEVDYSRFDKTLHETVLNAVEHQYINDTFIDHSTFRNVFKYALRTIGSSYLGTTYRVDGTRCSGDAHTSIGNGIINHFVTWFCLRKLPNDAWTSFHEGDDGVIGVTEPYAAQALANLEYIWMFGLVPKLVVSTSLDDCTFCGRFLVNCGTHILSYCDPMRTLAKVHLTISQGDLLFLLAAKCYSYLSTDIRTPVVSAWCRAMGRFALGKIGDGKRLEKFSKFLRVHAHDPEFRWRNQQFNQGKPILQTIGRQPEIPHEIRCAFARRTNIGIAEQIALEEMYTKQFVDSIPSSYPQIIVDWFLRPDCSITGDLFADS